MNTDEYNKRNTFIVLPLLTLHQDWVKSFLRLSPYVPPKTGTQRTYRNFSPANWDSKIKGLDSKNYHHDNKFYHRDSKNYHHDNKFYHHDGKNKIIISIVIFFITIVKIIIATSTLKVSTSTFHVRISGISVAMSGFKVIIPDLDMAIFIFNNARAVQSV
jgi:hypothetical protein